MWWIILRDMWSSLEHQMVCAKSGENCKAFLERWIVKGSNDGEDHSRVSI
jgi:hypothetical protein